MLVSEGANLLYGLDKSSYNYEDIKQIPLPEYRAMMDKALKNLIEKNVPYDIEFKIKTADTSELKDIHSVAIFDQEKEVVFGIIQDITVQKKAAETLLQSENKFRSITEQTKDFISIANNKAEIIYASPTSVDLFGMKPEEMIGRNFFEFVAESDIPKALNTFKENQEIGQNIRNFEFRLKRIDNSIFIAELSKTKIEYNAEEGILVVIRDITEQNEINERLRTSEAKFKAVAELSPIAIYASIGTEQKASYINEAFYKIFGFSKEDVPTVGQWWIKAFPDEKYRQKIFDQWSYNIEQAEKNNTDVAILECICTCKDGSEKIIAWVGKTISDEFWAFGYDLTEQKKSEIMLQERTNFIEKLVNLNPGMIYIYDIMNRRFVYSNDRIERVLGYSVQEVQDFGDAIMSSLMHPDDYINFRTKIVPAYSELSDGEQIVHQFRLKNKAGEWQWIESIEIIYSRNEDQSPLQILGMGLDITDRLIDERKLTESELFFRQSQEAANIGSYHLDMTSGLWSSSEVLDTIFGIDKEYVRNLEGWLELLAEEDREMMNDYFANQVLGQRQRFNKEYRVSRKSDGKISWVLGLGELTIENNVISAMTGTIQDITERKKIELELNEKMVEMTRFFKLTVGRELSMIDLKKEINELLVVSGENPKYKIVE